MDFSEGRASIPNLQGRVIECIDKCKVVQFYSEPQPGFSPKVPEGTELPPKEYIICFPYKEIFEFCRGLWCSGVSSEVAKVN